MPYDTSMYSPHGRKVLELAQREAVELGADHVGTEHILLAVLKESEGVGAQILFGYGITHAGVRAKALSMMAKSSKDSEAAKEKVQDAVAKLISDMIGVSKVLGEFLDERRKS